ncbi:restriction endonuclease subunit S [Acinetobacter beijerinckii]|uniref:restriction endonuclease subunit S n=1 Tax=Acinetobacter beijerinckii TaxID=262668 RepID=UPI0040551648
MAKYDLRCEFISTNVEGIQSIPKEWRIKQVRYLLKDGAEGIKIGPFGSALKLEDMVDDGFSVYGQENVIKKDFSLGKRKISETKFQEMSVYRIFPKDILITMMGTSGKCEIVPSDINDGIIDSHLLRVRVKEDQILPEFFKLLIDKSPEISYQIQVFGKGSIMHGLNSGIVKSLNLPLPSIEEQKLILNFLDHETAKIDTLIAKQEKLIELLKEKRQAVISHAVTKGLNPNVAMKDSGVEWLGEVPEHWATTKLKFVVKQIVDAEHKTAPYFEDGQYLVCRTTNVRDGKLRLEGGKYTNHQTFMEWTQRATPEIGDILFTREAPAGEACVYDGSIPLCLGQRMVLFKLDKETILPEFLLYSIYSGLADDFIKQLSQGSTVTHFNMADIQNIPLFELPMAEQEQVVQHLKNKLNEFRKLEDNVDKAIQLMQEHRTALISAAVTGKIDVRDWQNPNKNNHQDNMELSA